MFKVISLLKRWLSIFVIFAFLTSCYKSSTTKNTRGILEEVDANNTASSIEFTTPIIPGQKYRLDFTLAWQGIEGALFIQFGYNSSAGTTIDNNPSYQYTIKYKGRNDISGALEFGDPSGRMTPPFGNTTQLILTGKQCQIKKYTGLQGYFEFASTSFTYTNSNLTVVTNPIPSFTDPQQPASTAQPISELQGFGRATYSGFCVNSLTPNIARLVESEVLGAYNSNQAIPNRLIVSAMDTAGNPINLAGLLTLNVIY